MSNDRAPLKKFESPYGGGVSSLPGAAGDLPPVMFPVVPVLLAGGSQSSPWQVAVVRVDETPAGDSSEREYPGVTQSRHRPIDIYELPDCLPHTVVEGGPAGPEVIKPLALLVHDHADPAGQHAVMRNTIVEEVIEPLELLVLDHVDPAGQHAVFRDTTRLLDWLKGYRTGSRRHVRFRTLPWTVNLWRGLLTWSIWLRGGGSLDNRPMEVCYTLDSQLMEGNTYLEHSALGVSLDSGPTEVASCLEPLEQLVPSSSLAVRPVEGVTEKVSE